MFSITPYGNIEREKERDSERDSEGKKQNARGGERDEM